MKTLSQIEVSAGQVQLFGQVITRPATTSISEWMDFWERVKEVAEDEEFGASA